MLRTTITVPSDLAKQLKDRGGGFLSTGIQWVGYRWIELMEEMKKEIEEMFEDHEIEFILNAIDVPLQKETISLIPVIVAEAAGVDGLGEDFLKKVQSLPKPYLYALADLRQTQNRSQSHDPRNPKANDTL